MSRSAVIVVFISGSCPSLCVPLGTCTTWYTRGVGKQDLLDKVVADMQASGIGDRSLRDIGAAVGTSHRMLIHHFRSREGLLTEIVRRVEAEQRIFLTSVDVPPED